MIFKKDTYRQIIFLVLIISGTILSYNTWFHKNKDTAGNDNEKKNELMNSDICKTDIEAERLFGFFIKNPNSKKGMNSLFNAIVYWDSQGRDSSVQKAIKKFDLLIKDDSLKNNFYSRLGKYYITAPKKFNKSSGVNKAGNISAWFDINKLNTIYERGI